jgi:hypothetical protein
MRTIKDDLEDVVNGVYNGNISDLLKNVIDYIRLLENKMSYCELDDFRKKLDLLDKREK